MNLRRLAFLLPCSLLACIAPAAADCPDVKEAIETWYHGGAALQAEDDGANLTYGRLSDGSWCTLSLAKEGFYVFGTREKITATSPSSDTGAVTGQWSFRSDKEGGAAALLSFDLQSEDGTSIDGDASYTNSAGSVSVGYFESTWKGPFSPGDAFTRIPSVRGDPPKASETCFLDVRTLGKYLVVLDSGKASGACGGENVSFTGVYRRDP